MKFGRPRALSVAQQYVNLKGNPVSTGLGRLRAGKLVWIYDASPSTLSRTYGVRIEMDQDLSPDIFVEAPDLHALAEGRPLPHVYQQDPARLCLYLPGTPEWRPWMRLDQTVVPWTSLWLFYFEEWLASNEWKGGGEHPSATSETRYGRHRLGSRTTTRPTDGEASQT
jgi:hypothetical protein